MVTLRPPRLEIGPQFWRSPLFLGSDILVFHAQPGQKTLTSILDEQFMPLAPGLEYQGAKLAVLKCHEVCWDHWFLFSCSLIIARHTSLVHVFVFLWMSLYNYKRARASRWVPGWPGWPFSTFLFSCHSVCNSSSARSRFCESISRLSLISIGLSEALNTMRNVKKHRIIEGKPLILEIDMYQYSSWCSSFFLSLSGVRSYLAWPFQMQEWSKIFWAKCKDRLEMTNQQSCSTLLIFASAAGRAL